MIWYLRLAILLLLGSYLFVYPFGILLIALDMVPVWGTWMGGALLMVQGTIMGLWLVVNYWWRGLLAALSILVFAWAVEHIGVTTGFPFGVYTYTDTLYLKIVGVVPLAVPFAWLLVIPAAVGMTEYLLHRGSDHTESVRLFPRLPLTDDAHTPTFRATCRRCWSLLLENSRQPQPGQQRPTSDGRSTAATFPPTARTVVIILGGASFASFLDILIEPVAVHINRYWIWNHGGGGYYGVPGSNFAAWWVTSFLLVALLIGLTCSAKHPALTIPTAGDEVSYQWLPPLLYTLNLIMFVLVTLAHGKLLAVGFGSMLLGYLALARLEPRLKRWIMGDSQSTTA